MTNQAPMLKAPKILNLGIGISLDIGIWTLGFGKFKIRRILLMSRVRLPLIPYFGTVIEEGKKVVWPSRDIVIRHTILVVISVAIAIVIFASLDYGLQQLVVLAIKK